MARLAETLEKHPNLIIVKFKDPASERAIMSLNNHNVPYKKIDSEEDEELVKEIVQNTKKTNYPMIYINKTFIKDNSEFKSLLDSIGKKVHSK